MVCERGTGMLKRFGFSLTHGWNWRSVRCVAGFQHTIDFYTNGAVAQTVFNPLDNACRLTMGFLLENASKIKHPVWPAYGLLSNRFYGATLGDQVFMGGNHGF